MNARILLFLTALLAGCTTQPPAPVEDYSAALQSGRGVHTVLPGDTLYSIAWANGLNYRDLARWNNLPSPERIFAGQKISLRPPPGSAQGPRESRAAAPSPSPPSPPPSAGGAKRTWVWPVRGEVAETFSIARGNKGLDIRARRGDPVVAAAAGSVVYAGNGLRGYGNLIIIKHDASYLSAYAHNRRIRVAEGRQIRQGETIGEVGGAGKFTETLHFEIRREGRPVDPLRHLPPR